MDASPAPDSRRQALALAITGAAVFMVTLDNLVVTNALPSIRADLGRLDLAARLVRERLHPDVRGAAPDRSLARRPLRAPARLRHRPRDLHRRLPVGGTRALERHADRRAEHPGPRRRARHAAQPHAALGGVPRGAARPRDRHLVGPGRPRGRARTGRGRRGRGRTLVAVDLLPQRADRRRARSLRLPRARREPRPRQRDRRARPRAREHRPVRARVGHRARQRPGLDVARDRRRARARRERARAHSWPGSAARRRRCCRCASSAAAPSAPPTASR